MRKLTSPVSRVPVTEQRRRRWMSSEATFMRVEAMLLVPRQRPGKASGSAAGAVAGIGFEQLLRVCRKNGLKSKG